MPRSIGQAVRLSPPTRRCEPPPMEPSPMMHRGVLRRAASPWRPPRSTPPGRANAAVLGASE
jgi:hypothetical protein